MVVFNLPQGFRPPTLERYPVVIEERTSSWWTESRISMGMLSINKTGQVRVPRDMLVWASLNGITFRTY